MKNLFLIALIAALGTFASGPLWAADKVDKPQTPAEKTEKKAARPPFTGKIASLDKEARSFKIGARTFHITTTTKILMAGKPATLDDAKVGDEVGGQYREGEGGKLEVLSLRVGPKPEKKPSDNEKK